MSSTLRPFLGTIAGCLIFVALACGKPDQNPLKNDAGFGDGLPSTAGGDFQGERNFATLINTVPKGKLSPVPWAGYWWPYKSNGISAGSFDINRKGVSPAGKYDAARGRTTQAQSWEIQNHGSSVPKIQGWWGHCNGWCAAAALFPEPQAPVTVNGQNFGIADIKGLLTEGSMEASADYFGERVDWPNDMLTPKYDDIVPDQYFLVLTNYIGREHKRVLMDRDPGPEIWNQPVAGYEFDKPKPEDYLGPATSAGGPNVYRMIVRSRLWWVEDGVPPDCTTPEFNFEGAGCTNYAAGSSSVFSMRDLVMELWLDGPVVFGADGSVQSSGNVITFRKGDFVAGGAWRNGEGVYIHPDFMWIPYSVLKPTEYGNRHIDIDWIKDHVLTGRDDTTVVPATASPAPTPHSTVEPSPSPHSSATPHPTFVPLPTMPPTPRPTHHP